MSNAIIDKHIGNKIRLRRNALGFSQTILGQKIGVTFQQIQKYEKGLNKIVASKLFILANAMDIPIYYFFDETANGTQTNNISLEMHEESAEFSYEHLNSREAIILVRAYNNISNPNSRKKLLIFLKSLGQI